MALQGAKGGKRRASFFFFFLFFLWPWQTAKCLLSWEFMRLAAFLGLIQSLDPTSSRNSLYELPHFCRNSQELKS
ncbi:uncharacterized protein BO66DRAFT_225886 [Aspergillus aculeatinus CBS 121060]|uniref:Uncharacterized protein n=1 Tax=Aspergillus aculeatinus CBS 121060 TaxID=1448322 RepID=A0ACD1HIR1_9EURO|nr:hypothetical protein BO66DRAFT_225886 [Aspergillus aculeatinus CBS 121060]RAH73552.1 hypothetical protein BO66DRAFT_225886 [Aspergillus aculeatinus CBS 121060]